MDDQNRFPSQPESSQSLRESVPIRDNSQKWKIVGAFVVILVVVFGLVHRTDRVTPKRSSISFKSDFGQTLGLVQDKISQSAAIVVSLPAGMSLSPIEASQKITLNPEVKGEWVSRGNDKEIVLIPKTKLEIGRYYNVAFASGDIKLQKDFLVDEDPKIVSVFPRFDSEAPEGSDITIVFNRPMVPLTTLDNLSQKDIPVEIKPATPGKFKWITTRNLQFIPEKRLFRSTNYTVVLKEGLVSMDGLPVSSFTHNFTTRPLRYLGPEFHHSGLTLYNEPILIRFNQPVDLERTKENIQVIKLGTNQNLKFFVQYGRRRVYDESSKKSTDFLDKSVLEVYNALDRHGRERFWDFETSYQISISKAYSSEGDIDLSEARTAIFKVPEIIASLSADSPRSTNVEPGYFDPKGRLWVDFYEDIDKDSSSIKVLNLQEIGYGEKCRLDDEGKEIRSGNECEKTPNKKRIYLKLNPDSFGRVQNISIEFRKIINTAGALLNAENIIETITTYPELRIKRMIPSDNDKLAELNELKICSTTPLTPATEDNFYKQVKSNISVGRWNWRRPFRVDPSTSHTYRVCAVGEFENTISYGLIPESFYSLKLNLKDDFDQAVESSVDFTSKSIDQIYRRFNHLQKAYNVTSPERTKLTYSVENLEYVNLHICEIDSVTMLNYLNFNTRPSPTTPGANLACKKSLTKKVELPKKYWVKNYFQVELKDLIPKPLGHYVLSFDHPEYRQDQYDYRSGGYSKGVPVYERTFLTVTNLAVQEKKIERSEYAEQYSDITKIVPPRPYTNLYWVTKFGNLEAVSGARVDVYRKGAQFFTSSLTNTDGIARTKNESELMAAIVTKENDSTIVSSEFDKFQWASPSLPVEKTYIYTDRPIYRPGQEIFIKGISRVGYDGDYEIFRQKKPEVEIFNSKGESIFKQANEMNEYGTFTASFRLDKNASLGTYRIHALGGSSYVDVEEYVSSAFKVDVTSNQEEYIAGSKMVLGVDANYYFGVPLEGGEVQYSILAQDYYFDRYKDGYFQFGSGWYYSYDGGYGDKFILRGKTKLDERGKAVIEQTLDFNKFFSEEQKEKSKIFVVNMTVKNRNGQSVSQQKSFIVHRGKFYLGVNLEKRYFPKGEKNKILVKSVDINGKGINVSSIVAEINKIKWESFKRKEVDGRYYWHSEKKKEFIKKIDLRTDSQGNYSQDLTFDQEGEYEVVLQSTDYLNNTVKSVMDFYVYGSGEVSVRSTNNETLELAVDKNKINVGEKISVVIKSPYPKAKALVTIERGKIFDYSIVDIDQNLKDFSFSVTEEHIPNIYFSVVLLSPRPEIKYGQLSFSVNSKEKQINILIKSNKNHYLPGEQVTLEVDTEDSKNRPVEADVSIAVADLSVLALKGNPKKNPATFFYAGLPLAVTTASNIKNILYEAEVPVGTKGGGGGLEPEDLAKKKRGEFKDTAFWRGVVKTNTNGKAKVTFTLPDNLTTWQTEVVGITKDTKVGTGYREFGAKKDLMVVPLKPRFIIPGDEFMIGAKIFNQAEKAQKLKVSISSPSLELKNSTEQSLKLNAGESESVYFATKAPSNIQEGVHSFVISAKNEQYEDTVENQMFIRRNDTYEAVSTAHFTPENKAHEYIFLPENIIKEKGGVSIKTSATLAVFLSEALNYLVSYPYGCSEQIASKLSSISILKKGLNLKNIGDKFNLKDVEFEGQKYSIDDVIEIGLSRIYSNQSPGGGFTYYPTLQPSFHLTLHILNTLIDLTSAGYSVDQSVIYRAARYLYNEILNNNQLSQDNNLVILTAYTLGRLTNFQIENDILAEKILNITKNTKFIREDISNISLTHLAILLSGDYGGYGYKKDEIFKTLENRITVDGRGAFLPLNENQLMRDYYETPVKDTALMLKAFVADKRESPFFDKILRWILASRAKDGAWGSTNNTLSVIDSLTDLLQWKRETESQFTLEVSLDGKEKMKSVFGKDTILNTFETFIPTQDFKINSINKIDFNKTNQNSLANTFYYEMLLKYFLPIDSVPPRDEGFAITREFYGLEDKDYKTPLSEAKVGDVLKGHIKLVVPKDRNLVAIEDFIPAGMELVNFNLATEDQSLRKERKEEYGDYYYNKYSDGEPMGMGQESKLKNILALVTFGVFGESELGDEEYSPKKQNRSLFADAEESHDDRLFLFKERLAPGVYDFDYFVRALIPGKYHHLPAVASELYFPENFGRTSGGYFIIKK